MMSSGGWVGAAVGAVVGAAVGAAVGAGVGFGPGVAVGPALLLLGFGWRRGAGSAVALPSTVTFGFEEGSGTLGRTGSPVFGAGFVPPPLSSPPMLSTA